MTQLTTTTNNRRGITDVMAEKHEMHADAFKSTIVKTCFPNGNATQEQFAALLMVAREYDLNPITKEIYAFPGKGGGIVPIVSIDGWMNLMNSHPQMDGIEFTENKDDNGALESITCKIWRKDRSHPVVVTEYYDECKRSTEPWKQWPIRMLRHKAAIQCARVAFSFAGIVDEDESDRMIDVTPPSNAAEISQELEQEAAQAEASLQPEPHYNPPPDHGSMLEEGQPEEIEDETIVPTWMREQREMEGVPA